MKQISKKEAHDKYGVIISGANSLYRYYLTDDGYVVDSDGDYRYIPPSNPRGIHNGEETCKCTNCHKETPFTDVGGRCETDLGWLCNECIEQLKQEGIDLQFQDDELPD